MLEWVELATLPGPGGPSWSATSTAEDGTELRVQVWGERPGGYRRLVLGAGGHEGTAAFQLSAKGRPPTVSELVEAGSLACRSSPDWWVVPHPWRGDLEAPEAAELYLVGGLLVGPVRAGQGFLLQLQLGAVAPTPTAGVARNA